MARATDAARRRVVLDAGAVIALVRGDAVARMTVARARAEGLALAIPTPVIAQVHRGGRSRAGVDRVLAAVEIALPTSDATARLAGELLGLAELDDAIDAIVAAEALAAAPAVVLTSDRADIRRLLDAQPDGARVAVIEV